MKMLNRVVEYWCNVVLTTSYAGLMLLGIERLCRLGILPAIGSFIFVAIMYVIIKPKSWF